MMGCEITSSQCSELLRSDLGTLLCEDPLRWGGGFSLLGTLVGTQAKTTQ